MCKGHENESKKAPIKKKAKKILMIKCAIAPEEYAVFLA